MNNDVDVNVITSLDDDENLTIGLDDFVVRFNYINKTDIQIRCVQYAYWSFETDKIPAYSNLSFRHFSCSSRVC